MTTVVEISDTEDADDCVITSVVHVVDNTPSCDLYVESCKENHLLANFIKECLKLEHTIGMQKVLKDLLKFYYAVDKITRESPRFQKNLRRANYLIKTDPLHKFSHILDLCNILKGLKAKKRVPFVTLTNNITVNSSSKKSELNVNIVTPFSETINSNLNHSYADFCDGNISMENANQQSSIAEEDKLLIPKKDMPVFHTSVEKRIKAIEHKIAYYKKTIAMLDEQEVDDDSVNSPYIKSERLKVKIVSLYKERCQLIGSQPVKCKGIRLKLAEGRPPGPTKFLERFLNKNCNKDGDPPFPDFCDVITCVTEANEKDDLGWTKAQIMNEATALFTLCGRALQKRRQNREYRDLMDKVKLEELDKDPAEDDPQLQAKLEANKCIAVKKESEIIERYAMMQYLPSTSKSRKHTPSSESTGKVADITNMKSETQKKMTHTNNNYEAESVTPSIDKHEESNYGASLQSIEKNIVIAPTSNTNVESHKSLKQSSLNMDIENEENSTDSRLHRVDTKVGALEQCSNVKDRDIKAIPNKIFYYGAGNIVKVVNNDKNTTHIDNNISIMDNDLRMNDLNVINNPILQSIESPLNEDALTKLLKLWK